MASVMGKQTESLGVTMRDSQPSSPSVVVGIDGSRNGLTAALWAVDEAVARDIPLRLVYAIEPREDLMSPEESARALAEAETAVRMAFVAVESTEKPVKIEVEILQGRPTDMLLEAGRGAELICVGPIGIKNVAAGRIGSTAAALATRAHCPVAIVRGCYPAQTEPGAVLVEVDLSTDSDDTLERGVYEAALRKAPLIAISAWQSTTVAAHDTYAVTERNRQVDAALRRRSTRSTRRHPDLDIRSVAFHGRLLDYLSRHAPTIQLVVVGRRRTHGVAEMVGPPCYAALRGTDCSVLVCDPTNPL